MNSDIKKKILSPHSKPTSKDKNGDGLDSRHHKSSPSVPKTPRSYPPKSAAVPVSIPSTKKRPRHQHEGSSVGGAASESVGGGVNGTGGVGGINDYNICCYRLCDSGIRTIPGDRILESLFPEFFITIGDKIMRIHRKLLSKCIT